MEIVKLPPGEAAPADSDCIKILRQADGRHRLEGSVLLQCDEGEEAESESLLDGDPYASFEDAEAAGLAWASEHCVGTLYVSTQDAA
ncbi:hypothetical protein [Sphingomonas sp. M1-B02]|uniref:hypothetical protein n=1 Tax=Sphingomonas sp. M1-B02 TaxID=3114300 RepID=UPI00223E96F0|nr:hypothetical protein [Sphingomonas sp. S6-11]UZK64664.1 hypothetical protein OKW87_08920 [Sphingomonas sp. S6-11]